MTTTNKNDYTTLKAYNVLAVLSAYSYNRTLWVRINKHKMGYNIILTSTANHFLMLSNPLKICLSNVNIINVVEEPRTKCESLLFNRSFILFFGNNKIYGVFTFPQITCIMCVYERR